MEAELEANLENSTEVSLELENKQKNFFETIIGKAINSGLDIGLKAILPDLIEDQVINIKDAFLELGFKEGISTAIDEAINFGKSALGIITGNFENISQVETAIKNGGIIDSLSSGIDSIVNKLEDKGIVNSTIASLIKSGKNVILNTIEDNIENTIKDQKTISNNLDTYISNWKEYYNNKDFEGMEKSFEKIEKEVEELVPLENSLAQARIIENIHNLIKNNGQNFNLSETELELVQKLN